MIRRDAPAPGWFARAVAVKPRHADVVVDAARIHYRMWGAPGLAPVLLVHGGAAHSGWWDHIAPLLSDRCVVAIDLSGHGDSDHRSDYVMGQWVGEIAAVAAAERLDRPVVVGHSMGGWAAVAACVQRPQEFSAVAFIDTPLNGPLGQDEVRRRHRPHRIYSDRSEAAARFTPVPAQGVLPYVMQHLVGQSLRRVERGWTWKFDPKYFGSRVPFHELLPQLQCPAALLRGGEGLVPARMASEMQELVPGELDVIELTDSGHHPMLDEPLALASSLKGLLARWRDVRIGPRSDGEA